jgi:molybdate transport system ATP-binding protein
MMIEVAIQRRIGNFDLAVHFATEARGAALFGPSGSGKTSVVNCIAGLLTPARGRITIDGEVLFDSAKKIDLPAHRRRVGVVFQEARLFPHLTVAQNLHYGRWMQRITRDAAEEDRVVAMLDLGRLLARWPGRLSGGERQRVAIGRALLMRPRLLVLDEPLASLDAERKAEILPYLQRLRDDAHVPLVYVTHQPDEIRRVATQVVRLERGRVAAAGGLELLG